MMDRDDICIHASLPDIDGARLCVNNKSNKGQNKICVGVHACSDGEV